MNKYLILSLLTMSLLSLSQARASAEIENLTFGYTAQITKGFSWDIFSAFQNGNVCEWGVDGYSISSTDAILPSCEMRTMILNQQGLLQPPKSLIATIEPGNLKVVSGAFDSGLYFIHGVVLQHQST